MGWNGQVRFLQLVVFLGSHAKRCAEIRCCYRPGSYINSWLGLLLFVLLDGERRVPTKMVRVARK